MFGSYLRERVHELKLTTIACAVLCLLMALSVRVLAGDYHVGSTLKCNQCHASHGGAGHAFGDESDKGVDKAGAFTASAHLLKQSDINSLCLRCHDGGEAVDVYGAAGSGQPKHRSAGCFNGDATGSYAPFASDFGHNLKNGGETPPGGTGSYDLDCASCHDPHGNDNYRNLKDLGKGAISYAKSANDNSKDVFESKPYPSGSVVESYDASNISYNLPEEGSHHLEGFCVSCHTSVHAGNSTSGSWTRHPTIGISRSYTSGTVSSLKTLGGSPAAGGSGALTAGQVSCVTCHKAHGSTHPFGLIYDNRTTAEIEDGASIAATCKHCHDKGLTSTE
jgi:predicted CXXCH cytochrome family protein